MIKYFCDVCDKEIPADEAANRVNRKLGFLEVQVIHSWKGMSNTGNICHDCITLAVVKGKQVNIHLLENND